MSPAHASSGRLALVVFAVSLLRAGAASVDWHAGPDVRWAGVAPAGSGSAGFASQPASLTGITFSNTLSSAAMDANRILENGSGVALGDVDGDGWCDIYFCSLAGENHLYRNLGGWRFQDITAAAGVGCGQHPSTGAALADLDGDGSLDLLVNQLGHGTRLFLGDGKGHFKESLDSGLLPRYGAHSMTLADIDGDGDLDLYVANYRASTFKDLEGDATIRLRNVNGNYQVPPEYAEQFMVVKTQAGTALVEVGEPDALYLNDGHGHFQVVSWTDGTFSDAAGRPLKSPPRDWGLSAQFRDMNGDGAPDLYVCNDFFSPDRMWINDGLGHFKPASRQALRETPFASMAVDFADINRDGHDDFIAMEMMSRSHTMRQIQRDNFELDPIPWWGWPHEDPRQIESQPQLKRNTLFVNRGDNTYAETAQFSGLQASGWSWGSVFLDVDLDGYEDLLIATGHPRDATDSDALRAFGSAQNSGGKKPPAAGSLFPKLSLPKLAFRNRGDLTFTDMSSEWGFNSLGISHGMAVADLDNDGDLDVVVNTMNGPAELFRNNSTAPRLAVRLKGSPGNPQGVGAKIRVSGGPVPQSQEMICGGRYLSSDDPMRTFAAGSATNRLRVEVTWRGGLRSVVEGAVPNRIYEIAEPSAVPSARSTAPEAANAPTFFEDMSASLGHLHAETRYEDFERQPLLSRRLSQLGPGVAWMDLDGDGWMDLVIGSGRGGRTGVFRNTGQGGFRALALPGLDGPAADDQAGLIGWSSEPGQSTLLIAQSSYELAQASAPGVTQYDLFFGNAEARPAVPADPSSPGPLALTDLDGDGSLELFVGGRVIPGRYPAAPSSRLFRKTPKGWAPDDRAAESLKDVGLVSGAVWTDLNADGHPELALACEWGPLRVLRSEAGTLKSWDAPVVWQGPWLGGGQPPSRLSQLTGWWTGVSAGDFDGDGRLDLVAGNWGLNCKYREFLSGGLRVYHGDLDGDGVEELIEAYWEPAMKKVVPWRDWKTLRGAIPSLTERFSSYRAFGEAGVEEILGDAFKGLHELRVDVLESVLLLNRGDHFECRPLPQAAQLAPVFGLCVGDYDGDGHEDLYLGQNFFGTDPETGRYDAGRGLWLHGDGKGGFEPVSGHISGILVYGEQRGAALCDYDGDGRVDLVTSQNGAATKLYHNREGRPGLRVRAVGAGANGSGFGAVIRLGRDGLWGAARELHAGSGYWSQDSPVQVMSLGNLQPTKVEVRWPGGKSTTSAIPQDARDIQLSTDGTIQIVK